MLYLPGICFGNHHLEQLEDETVSCSPSAEIQAKMADPVSITASAITLIQAVGALNRGVRRLRELPGAPDKCQDVINRVREQHSGQPAYLA